MATVGRSARDKGADAERCVAKMLRDIWGYTDCRRGRVFDGEPDIVGLYGIHIEVKRVETLNIEKALEQSERESAKKDGGIPIVIHRKSQEKHWKVTLRAKDWDYIRFLHSFDEYMVHVSLEDFMDAYGEWYDNEVNGNG